MFERREDTHDKRFIKQIMNQQHTMGPIEIPKSSHEQNIKSNDTLKIIRPTVQPMHLRIV